MLQDKEKTWVTPMNPRDGCRGESKSSSHHYSNNNYYSIINDVIVINYCNTY